MIPGSPNRLLLLRQLIALAAGLVLLSGFAGCWKRNGEAVIIGKEYVAAMEISATPKADNNASPIEPVTGDSPKQLAGSDDLATVEPEESTGVDDQGPAQDPRATDHDQWIVNVRMTNNARKIDVRVEPPQ